MEELSGECAVERSGTKDMKVLTGVREGCGGRGNRSLLSRADRVVYSSMELAQTEY